MLLIRGELWEDGRMEEALSDLETHLTRTLSAPPLDPMLVVNACDKLARAVEAGEYAAELEAFLAVHEVPRAMVEDAIGQFKKDSLLYKLKMELGEETLEPLCAGTLVWQRRRFPLGVLFHIAAGNVDGLPAYSVVEGLLAGNVNLLKLPSADGGLSVRLLYALTQTEPALADYIYVFDMPSTDLDGMTRLAAFADGVVVWGGDEAVRDARRLAHPGTRIITWGHKLSFAYATTDASKEDILALARHICLTGQVLCTSCQGVYVDSEDPRDVRRFAKKLLFALSKAAKELPAVDPGLRGQVTLRLYNEKLEAAQSGRKILRGDGVSVLICPDDELELSFLHGNCWVKALPRDRLIATLRRKKEYLQTAGLLCAPQDCAELTELLCRAGVVRVTEAGMMSRTVSGEAHDGTFPLREYTRVAEGLW
ncbi:MAG: acyl-CoA reductase [Butyricicoccus sp.]|nr:acyl-CoA reductase [Butyricicoccus sp.]MBQ8585438.1 acyl-CoA reductase [Butyricicoccus sp.]